MKKAIKLNEEIIIGVPKKWVRLATPNHTTLGYDELEDSEHFLDGWKQVITPNYDSTIQRLGTLLENENDFTYEIIALTDEEIQNEAISQSEADKQLLIQSQLEAEIIATAQDETDTETILNNQSLYPFWVEDIDVIVDEKYQAFDNNELKLYKVIQSHSTQSGWHPSLTPALFVRVQLGETILDWVQPTGAHDAYNIGDKVMYNGLVYESTVNANVYAPLVVAGQWVLV